MQINLLKNCGYQQPNAGISSTIFNLQGPLIALLGALFYMEYPGNLVLTGLLA